MRPPLTYVETREAAVLVFGIEAAEEHAEEVRDDGDEFVRSWVLVDELKAEMAGQYPQVGVAATDRLC